MKIELRQLPEGESVSFLEHKEQEALDLATTDIKLTSPLEIKTDIIKFQDALDIQVHLKTNARMRCSRCLVEIDVALAKDFRLDYPINKNDTVIDITDDIRQEVILDYPLKPLCRPLCKGLCIKCGKNLNEGNCSCK